jgi:hypothetical protein
MKTVCLPKYSADSRDSNLNFMSPFTTVAVLISTKRLAEISMTTFAVSTGVHGNFPATYVEAIRDEEGPEDKVL